MSYFHKTLSKLYRKSADEDRLEVIEQHISKLREEFANEERLRGLLKEYYGQLERIKKMILGSPGEIAGKGVKTQGDPVIAEIHRAHEMILEIEKLIAQIYGETHKFLE